MKRTGTAGGSAGGKKESKKHPQCESGDADKNKKKKETKKAAWGTGGSAVGADRDTRSKDEAPTAKKDEAQGVALCIGLNAVDPDHYGGWSGRLNACEEDARDMSRIAASRGFADVVTLLTK